MHTANMYGNLLVLLVVMASHGKLTQARELDSQRLLKPELLYAGHADQNTDRSALIDQFNVLDVQPDSSKMLSKRAPLAPAVMSPQQLQKLILDLVKGGLSPQDIVGLLTSSGLDQTLIAQLFQECSIPLDGLNLPLPPGVNGPTPPSSDLPPPGRSFFSVPPACQFRRCRCRSRRRTYFDQIALQLANANPNVFGQSVLPIEVPLPVESSGFVGSSGSVGFQDSFSGDFQTSFYNRFPGFFGIPRVREYFQGSFFDNQLGFLSNSVFLNNYWRSGGRFTGFWNGWYSSGGYSYNRNNGFNYSPFVPFNTYGGGGYFNGVYNNGGYFNGGYGFGGYGQGYSGYSGSFSEYANGGYSGYGSRGFGDFGTFGGNGYGRYGRNGFGGFEGFGSRGFGYDRYGYSNGRYSDWWRSSGGGSFSERYGGSYNSGFYDRFRGYGSGQFREQFGGYSNGRFTERFGGSFNFNDRYGGYNNGGRYRFGNGDPRWRNTYNPDNRNWGRVSGGGSTNFGNFGSRNIVN